MPSRLPDLQGLAGAWVALVLVCLSLAATRAFDGGRPAPASAPSGQAPGLRDPARPPRIALFQAAGFPTVDAPALDPAVLRRALEGLPVEDLATPEAMGQLARARFDVLVLPYGSAFPLDAWDAIRGFVKEGGSLVVLGGAPFHQPVSIGAPADGSGAPAWRTGPRQPTFAHDFLIGPAEAVAMPSPAGPSADVRLLSEWRVPIARPKTVHALTVRFATRPDLPGEEGAAGPRDAILRPLAHVVDATGSPVGCPLLEIDRLRGNEAGARWVLAASDAPLSGEAIRGAVERALEGAVEIVARPTRAAIDAGEATAVHITVRRPSPRAGEAIASRAHLVVRDNAGRVVRQLDVSLSGPPQGASGQAAIATQPGWSPGLYHVEVAIPDVAWHPQSITTGFWVRDRKLLASGPRITVSRDWLRRDGKVFPIVGTTYMASDVHRKFLFEPNPHLWDLDFAEMRRRGVNFVRTGLWTGWSRLMLDPGAVDESALEALDAFVLTAGRHDIVICFTFFAFLPPAFGGVNAYLDPRALEGQRELVTKVASRYRDVGWIHFDLINEPSYAPLDKLWQTRPMRDIVERRAWEEWVRLRHGDDPRVLRDRWREAGADPLRPPDDEAFAYAMVRGDRHPRKVRDFVEFTQDVVARWAAVLRGWIRSVAGETLVTMGQDEGGTATRPSPQLHADAVDYTAVHTWWNNDDLLWDGVVTKVAGKPHLVQETGLMRLEDPDGMPWRSPEQAAALLERKFALAFGARGAGAVEWAWNINPYQPIDNEAVIGLIRPDGTAKPELAVVGDFATFVAQAAPWLDDYEADPVVVVLPHSRLFAGRPGGLDAVKAVVRTLAERFGIVPAAISELRLTADRLRGARLVIVPTPEMLDDGAARALVEAARAGRTVLVTGAVEGTPYGEATDSLRAMGVLGAGLPLAFHEPTPWGGADARAGVVTFDQGLTQFLRKGARASFGEAVPHILHEPLPIEFGREREPLVALLAETLARAGLPASMPSPDRLTTRVLVAPRAALVVAVNESARDATASIKVDGRAMSVSVAAGRARLMLMERGNGRILCATGGTAAFQQR